MAWAHQLLDFVPSLQEGVRKTSMRSDLPL